MSFELPVGRDERNRLDAIVRYIFQTDSYCVRMSQIGSPAVVCYRPDLDPNAVWTSEGRHSVQVDGATFTFSSKEVVVSTGHNGMDAVNNAVFNFEKTILDEEARHSFEERVTTVKAVLEAEIKREEISLMALQMTATALNEMEEEEPDE